MSSNEETAEPRPHAANRYLHPDIIDQEDGDGDVSTDGEGDYEGEDYDKAETDEDVFIARLNRNLLRLMHFGCWMRTVFLGMEKTMAAEDLKEDAKQHLNDCEYSLMMVPIPYRGFYESLSKLQTAAVSLHSHLPESHTYSVYHHQFVGRKMSIIATSVEKLRVADNASAQGALTDYLSTRKTRVLDVFKRCMRMKQWMLHRMQYANENDDIRVRAVEACGRLVEGIKRNPFIVADLDTALGDVFSCCHYLQTEVEVPEDRGSDFDEWTDADFDQLCKRVTAISRLT